MDTTTKILWSLGILFYGVLDTALTIYLLQFNGVFEGNEMAVWFIDLFGSTGLIVHKLLGLSLLYLLWRYYPSIQNFGKEPYRKIVPVLTILKGLYLTVNHLDIWLFYVGI